MNNNNNDNEITREKIHNEEKDIVKNKISKKHKIIIVVSLIVLIILITVFILILFLGGKKQHKSKEIVAEKELTEKEFKAIIDAYGDAATLASNNFVALKKGEIPTFELIKDTIVFDNYKVECKISKINFDGSVYLSNCTVDGKNINSKYSYGEEKVEKTKSGDKIYLYKRTIDYEGNNSNTGASYHYKKYYVSTNVNNYEGMTLVETYECETKSCVGYDYSDKNNKIIIYDGDYYLYDISTKNKSNLNIDKNNEYYDIAYVENSNKIYGISIRKKSNDYNSLCAFYNLDSNVLVTNYNYNQFYALDSKDYVFANLNENTVLLDTLGRTIKTVNGLQYITEVNINSNIYYYAQVYSEGPNYSNVVLNSNLDRIVPYDDCDAVFNSDSTISVMKYNDNHFYTYDISGNLLYTSVDYNSVVKVIKDYIIVLNTNNDLVLLNRSGEELANFLNVTDKHYLHPLISGWYTTNGKNGIYFVVGDNDIPYGTLGSGLEYYYIPSTGEVGVIKTEGVGGYAKPVLYLYPTKKTKVEVSFEKPELLTTTYPKYGSSWNVEANKNGDLYDKSGKYYYGLYWEEEGSTKVDFKEGFYVNKDSAIEFLEEKLTVIGLNDREKNEFIMYWLPILEKNKHNLVYFELTSEREKYNKINIKPKPDSLLRVAIHVKKVDGKKDIKEQKLSTFKRKGFAAIEWGGVVHD